MSDASDLGARTSRALRRYGLDLCEMYLLGTARLEAPVPPRLFASFTQRLFDGDFRGEFTLAQYEEGLERLIQKGLLCIVAPAEIEAESARYERAGIVAIRVRNYSQEDNVDFTQKGYDLDTAIVAEIWGHERLERKWARWRVDSAARRVDVYGSTADECQKTIERVMDPIRPFFGKREHRYLVAQPPSPIGAWSPKRFVTVPTGFHAVVTYTVEAEPS